VLVYAIDLDNLSGRHHSKDFYTLALLVMIHLQDNAYKKVPTSIGRLLMYSMVQNLYLQFLWNVLCKIYKIRCKKYLFGPLSC